MTTKWHMEALFWYGADWMKEKRRSCHLRTHHDIYADSPLIDHVTPNCHRHTLRIIPSFGGVAVGISKYQREN